MAGPSILLTGATGNLGAVILEQLLAANYTVHAVIRSLAKHHGHFERNYSTQLAAGQLQLVEIADMSVPGVFDATAAQADFILHAATPLAYSDFRAAMIEPAWTINHNVLTAAAKSGRVRRVIITGTIAACMWFYKDLFKPERTISAETWNETPDEVAADNVRNAYGYSKVTSEKKSWAFMKENKPGYDLVFLLAPAITGKSIQPGFVPSKEHLGGTAAIWRELFDRESVGFLPPWFMDVEDVAAIHVKALDTAAVPGNERYLFHAPELMNGHQIAHQIHANYPELRNQVPAGSAEAVWPQPLAKTDISKANKVFGTNWKSPWASANESVKDLIKAGVIGDGKRLG